MYRASLARVARQAASRPSALPVVQRRAASSVTEAAKDAANKIKDAAAEVNPVGHHKPSSDVPWAVGSLLVFAPLLFYMTSPPSKDHHHVEKPSKRRYEVRMPDPNAPHYKIPEDKQDIAGEGVGPGENDHALKAMAEDNEHKEMSQKSPEGEGNSDNYAAAPGLKGNADKFKAASRAQTQLFQEGGGEALRNPKLATQLGREAAADNSPRGGKEGHGDTDTPSSVKDKVGEKLTEKREDDREKGKTEDDDAEK